MPRAIRLANEKDHWLATLAGGTTVPEYLRLWRCLQNDPDLDRDAAASNATERDLTMRRNYQNDALGRRGVNRKFCRSLRASLRQ